VIKPFSFATDSDEHCSMDATVALHVEYVPAVCI